MAGRPRRRTSTSSFFDSKKLVDAKAKPWHDEIAEWID
jgi:hypothetical protein